jgi:hypothetical protein
MIVPIRSTFVESPADWFGPALAATNDWIYQLTPADVAEIDAAFRSARSHGRTLETLERADFPLPSFSARLSHALDFIENQRGIYVLRGLPTALYSKDDLRLIYWGIGKHLGTAVSQSKDGDLLGDVRNFGSDVNSAEGRGYKSKQRLSFHTDSCDVVALMVLRTAMSGGTSMIASSVAIHNELARTHPELLDVLYEPYPWSWQGQEPPGEPGWYLQPLFSRHDGKFACRYIRLHITNSQRFPDAPRLTDAQIAAMDAIDALAWSEDVHLSMYFEPGDIQVLCNHTCLHSRTAFEDYPEEDRRRHLLRMWLAVPNSRSLAPGMATIYQDQRPGAVRGGFPSRTGQHHFHTIGTLAD